MPQLFPGPSELDSRLAEIDRRLQEIQAGLAPDVAATEAVGAPEAVTHTAPPPQARPAAVTPPQSPRSGPLATLLARTRRRRSDGPGDEITELVRMHNGLLEAVGELVRLLGGRAAGPASEPTPGGLVSAGPFTDTRQVESFMLMLAALEPVRDAALVGYEGADRALIEVQLFGPSG